jgi:thioredoxin-related protein
MTVRLQMYMRKVSFLTILGLLLMISLRAGSEHESVWMTFQQAQDKAKAEPRIIIMDIYTDWCYWCKVMEHNTYSDPKVAVYLQDKFYPVRFNAESKVPVSWKGQSFEYNPDHRVNDLAFSLTQGHLAYPTTVIITPDEHNPVYIQGFLKPSDMEPILKYFGEGAYKTMSYPQFKKTFQSSWK